MGDDEKALLEAVERQDIEKVKQLLDSGINVNIENQFGLSLFTIALANDNSKIARLLIAADTTMPVSLREWVSTHENDTRPFINNNSFIKYEKGATE